MTKLLCLLFCLSSVFYASAQTGSTGPALERRPAPAPEYTLGTGDTLVLHVTDLDDLPATPIAIDPSGCIDVPLAGRVQAAGLTLSQLKASLAAKLSKFISHPEISINLAQSGSQPVTVVGEVGSPGVRQLDGSKHLLEVLSLSGGAKPDAGPNVLVTRQAKWGPLPGSNVRIDPATGDSTATFSLDALLASKAPADNILIRPDDVISVPKAELIYVLGDVKKAGGFELSAHQTMPVSEVLALAGGLAPDNGAGHARILRTPPGEGRPHEIPIDLPKILQGKADDVQLIANDVLFIPHSNVKVTSRRALEVAIGITTGLLVYR